MKAIAALALFTLATTSAAAQSIGIGNAFQVPTLDEGGLVALVALVGAVGAFIARRRGK